MKAAIDWLKQNDITGVAIEGNPLSKLANIMPEIDPEMVQQRLYGKKSKRSGPKFANGNYKSYQKAYDASPTQKKKRAALNRENHKRGTYGNGDGKDVAHTKSGKTKTTDR